MLKGAGAAVGAITVGCGDDEEVALGDAAVDATADTGADSGPPPPPPPTGVFQHGVASGDPIAAGVILWTRATVDTPSAEVSWTVAKDVALSDVVASGMETTDASRDFTVKIDLPELEPATTYYYRFEAAGEMSRIGRTRTAPEGFVSNARFAVMSCSSFPHGWFHAYRHVAERTDLDAVVHLGDYIYEYAERDFGVLRPSEPAHEIVSLEDYRTRYSQYRRDTDLQAVHQQHPFITVWDDHETANNSFEDGADNHDPATEGDWEARKAVAFQAYLEWMPIRETGEPLKIWRALKYGDLIDLYLLDTRLWGRQQQPSEEMRADPGRQILGADQEAWLMEHLEESTANWRVLGQQVMLAQLEQATDAGAYAAINLDQWDGYVDARQRLLPALAEAGNVVVLTGDIHSSWGSDITSAPHSEGYDPQTGEGASAVELVTSSVTSPSVGAALAATLEWLALEQNSHIQYVNFSQRGYILLDVDIDRVQADYYLLDGVEMDQGNQALAQSLQVRSGTNHLVTAPMPIAPRPAPDPAPDPPPRPFYS